jgi:predicted transcriptional regulator
MKYRSEEGIIAKILKIAIDGVSKTDILYGARLTYFQLQKYLAWLGETKLLSHNESKGVYKTTDKGAKFITLHDELDNLLK